MFIFVFVGLVKFHAQVFAPEVKTVSKVVLWLPCTRRNWHFIFLPIVFFVFIQLRNAKNLYKVLKCVYILSKCLYMSLHMVIFKPHFALLFSLSFFSWHNWLWNWSKYMKLSSFFVMKELTDTSDRVSYKDVFLKKIFISIVGFFHLIFHSNSIFVIRSWKHFFNAIYC